MKGTHIRYVAIAEGAKTDFNATLSAPTISALDNVSILKLDDVAFNAMTNPTDLYSTLLDGTSEVLPNGEVDEHVGIWSEQISDSTGAFATPIVLTLSASAQHSSMGITLEFDTDNNIHCNALNIKWYRGGELLADKDFTPDSATYLCNCVVTLYDKVVITFNKTNMPYNRLRLRSIQYGAKLIFGGNELTSVQLSNSISPISLELPIGTCDFTLMSGRDLDYLFEERQPLTVYLDDTLMATTYLETAKRKARRIYNISSENCVGILEDTAFVGGVYSDKPAKELISELSSLSGVSISLSEELQDETVTGYIEYTTCREALLNIAFAIGGVPFPTNDGKIIVRSLSDEIKTTIPRSRIMQGMSFTNEKAVSAVEIYAHSYTRSDETEDLFDAENDGTGQNIMIDFGSPYHSLVIENGSIIESGANYAVINADEGCKLTGSKYTHTTTQKRKKNPYLLSSVTGSVVTVKNATLINANNVDKALERCYNYYTNKQKTSLKIIEYKGNVLPNGETYIKTDIGDNITTETEYLGDVSGRITEQKFTLNSNVIAKDTILQ